MQLPVTFLFVCISFIQSLAQSAFLKMLLVPYPFKKQHLVIEILISLNIQVGIFAGCFLFISGKMVCRLF